MAGNQNSGLKREKLVREALMVAANRIVDGDPSGRKALYVAAEKVMQAAVEGDLAAFKEVADRIDGKAPQSMDIVTTHERSVSDWTESELDAAIASVRGKAAKSNGSAKSDRVH